MGYAGRVLLTGANGFIASHILAGLIERNYYVIATVRTQAKADDILALHPSWKEHITFFYVSDMTAPDAYDEVFKSGPIDYIVHNASPLHFRNDDIQRDIIDPAVNGATNIAEAAYKYGGKSVKRFVLLASAVAIADSTRGDAKPGKPYSEADWNPITAQYAIDAKDGGAGYVVSKKLAEQALWKFVEEKKPSFTVTALNPVIVTGPMLQAVPSPSAVNMSNSFSIWALISGDVANIDGVKWPFYDYVDVRDVALAHILAMTEPEAAGKRVALVAGHVSPQKVLRIINKNFPELKDRVAKGDTTKEFPEGIDPSGWDNSLSTKLFGKGGFKYTSLEDSIVDTVKDLLEKEKSWSS